jgi:hypothetical protein
MICRSETQKLIKNLICIILMQRSKMSREVQADPIAIRRLSDNTLDHVLDGHNTQHRNIQLDQQIMQQQIRDIMQGDVERQQHMLEQENRNQQTLMTVQRTSQDQITQQNRSDRLQSMIHDQGMRQDEMRHDMMYAEITRETQSDQMRDHAANQANMQKEIDTNVSQQQHNHKRIDDLEHPPKKCSCSWMCGPCFGCEFMIK